MSSFTTPSSQEFIQAVTVNQRHEWLQNFIKIYSIHYRRRWLLSVGAYSFCQQENERLTANMRLIGIPSITMGGVIIINASGLEYCG